MPQCDLCPLHLSSKALYLGQRQQTREEARVAREALREHHTRTPQAPSFRLQQSKGSPVVHISARVGVQQHCTPMQLARHVWVTPHISLKLGIRVHDLGIAGVVLQASLEQHPCFVVLFERSHDARPHQVQVLVAAVHLVCAQAELLGQLWVPPCQLHPCCQHIQRLILRALAQRLCQHDARVAHVVALKLSIGPMVQHHARTARLWPARVPSTCVRSRPPQVARRPPHSAHVPFKPPPCEQCLHQRHRRSCASVNAYRQPPCTAAVTTPGAAGRSIPLIHTATAAKSHSPASPLLAMALGSVRAGAGGTLRCCCCSSGGSLVAALRDSHCHAEQAACHAWLLQLRGSLCPRDPCVHIGLRPSKVAAH
mmetsp:Transcript_3841/g.10375  ORF Transcript_3841/g.10375 Transcript_3841/m.10375 type:complete len:368 (-) Transcript_3841:121-1224(-)